jgi:very-short-patch-repair endonuclease
MPIKDQTQLGHAKSMRTDQTAPEKRLWSHLRGKRLSGVKFTRQVLIGPYIADFAARAAKLVIEVDGATHGHQVAYDESRTAFLEGEGWCVLRFTNAEVLHNMEGVLAVIMEKLA